jgi:hypothetical protein
MAADGADPMIVIESTPAERSEQVRQDLGIALSEWAAMNRQQRRAAARRYTKSSGQS